MAPASDPPSPQGVADDLWCRVRVLTGRLREMEAVAAEGDLDEASRVRLDRTRTRLARAVDRAQLADDLSDRLADVAPRRSRLSES